MSSSPRPLREVPRPWSGPALAAVAAVVLAVVAVLPSAPASAAGAARPGADVPVGQLLLDEDFDGTALDRSTWGTCYGYRTTDCTNEFNREEQVYVEDAITVGGGEARLTARRESRRGYLQDGTPRELGYASGLISTEGRFSFTYGYAEFRARVPKGRGLWPAVWMLPDSKRWPPEIDVMEYIGSQPDRVYMTRHTPGGPARSAAFIGPDFSEGFHTFAVDWRPGSLVWYVDGVERFRVSDGVPDEPMYLLANLAVGGTWPGSPDATTAFPATLRLDSVRVWASADTVAPAVGTPVVPLPADSPLHPARWTSTWGGARLDGDRVELPVTRGYPTATSPRSDLRGRAVSVRVAAPGPGGDSEVGALVGDDQRHAGFVQAGSDLLMRAQADGGLTSTLVRFDPVRHRTWRVRDEAGTTVWETSPDGATWTVQRRAAVGLDLRDAHVRLRAGTWAGSDTGTTVVLDRLAVEGPTAPSEPQAPQTPPAPGSGLPTAPAPVVPAPDAPAPAPVLGPVAGPTAAQGPPAAPSSAPAAPTLVAQGPAQLPAGGTLVVSGTAQPGARVELHVRERGASASSRVSTGRASASGTYRLARRLRTDVRWFVRSGRSETPHALTQVTPTLDGGAVRTVARGRTTLLSGRAAPGSTVTLRFTRVPSRTAVVRRVQAGADGRWLRAVRPDVDHRVDVRSGRVSTATSLLRAR